MLSQLTIRNFGLIDELSIEFNKSLNVLTGETGAGKSIIIDALRCALGERLNSSYIRNPDKNCFLEAVFECSSSLITTSPLLTDYFQDEETTLILSRTILPDGRNKVKINGITVTVSTLKELGRVLIDFHGPHDHQMLLDPESHITILDRLSSITENINDYTQSWNEYQSTLKNYRYIQESKQSRERDLDLLSHQIAELEEVPLNQEQYDETQSEFARLSNTEKLHDNTQALIDLLERDESGITELLSNAFGHMRILNATDSSTERFEEALESIQENTDTLLADLSSYRDSLSFSQDSSSDVIRRCDSYTDILRKYGPTITDAQTFHASAKEKYDTLIDLDHNDVELKKQLETLKKELQTKANILSKKRKKNADSLRTTIEKELRELGIKHVEFECKITPTELRSDGSDTACFFISPNAGESLKPLAEIVSSGEAARVMLALKKALTKVDPIPVLIFDEIDAQIGGRLGIVTGKKLKDLSRDRQVLLITHLPQIASFADLHLKVEKNVENNHTIVHVRELQADGKIAELAHMLSGEQTDTISHKHAKELLVRAKQHA